jgi:hypothetical protein
MMAGPKAVGPARPALDDDRHDMSTVRARDVRASDGMRGVPNWVGCLFAAVFALHAANYLYFFVDDEAIPYVFAQNLLNGKGLRYNSFEGPVEGYSDFLHVVVATAVLGSVRLLHLDKVAVFSISTVWSLVCGVGVVWLTFGLLRRLPEIRAPGLVAGMAFLSLAGPLAVWSCSSLETATFALLLTVLVVSTVAPPRDVLAARIGAAAATAALLTRVDGFVYVGTVIGSAMLVCDARRRRDLFVRVVLPSVAVFTVYQLWRIWYFGDLLPAPVVTKVLYKLQPHQHLLVKAPPQNYARAFFGLYGAVPLIALCVGGLGWSRSRVVVACATAAAVLTAYIALVGDWMFGFRFFLPVLPLLAVLVANSVTVFAKRWRDVVGGMVAVGCVIWFGIVASTFFQRYVRLGNGSWLTHPTLDPHRHFSRYYSLVEQARGLVHAGDRTAYNQAGFLPFMLDVDNIDDLGLCSRFFAELPTTDVFMTEVGRYAPPTNKPVHTAGQAYLLYRHPTFVMYPSDLVRNANNNTIPDALFGDYYRFVFLDPAGRNVLYVRTDRSVRPFTTDPHQFLENLAHVTHVRRASVNGSAVPQRDITAVFPWLREKTGRVTVAGRYSADVTFANEDEPVYQVFVSWLSTHAPVTVTVTLEDGAGAGVFQQRVELDKGRSRGFHSVLPMAVRARRVRIEAEAHTAAPARLSIGDVRVQGQTRALAAYIQRTLQFPAP